MVRYLPSFQLRDTRQLYSRLDPFKYATENLHIHLYFFLRDFVNFSDAVRNLSALSISVKYLLSENY